MSMPQSNPNNPYANTGMGGGAKRPPSGQKSGAVTAPAIALIVVGSLDLLHGLYTTAVNLMNMINGVKPEIPDELRNNPDAQFMVDFMENSGHATNVGISVFMLFLSALMLFGAIQYLQRKSYGMALAASIIAVIPCTGIMDCCIVEIGLGIWALVVILQGKTKAEFN